MLCKHHFSKNGQVFFHIFWVVTLIMQSRILLLNRDLKLSSKGLSRLINPQNPYIVLTTLDGRLDFTFISMSNLKKLKSELMSLEIKSMD
ncbi:hypothetical protein EFT57_14755 [Lacticaseibacillus paracasei]|nr:hypothetical protein [Lacticaseibacillus paracasei]